MAWKRNEVRAMAYSKDSLKKGEPGAGMMHLRQGNGSDGGWPVSPLQATIGAGGQTEWVTAICWPRSS
jgi:hypothetical protein